MRKDPAKASFPLVDYSSDDMACSMFHLIASTQTIRD
jgi:hypothetical protein